MRSLNAAREKSVFMRKQKNEIVKRIYLCDSPEYRKSTTQRQWIKIREKIRSGGNGFMKVLLVNGSPHANGSTYTALHEMEKVFTEEGIEAEIIQI